MKIKFLLIVTLILTLLSIALYGQDFNYQVIDEHALNTPKEIEKSMESLSVYLTKDIKNDFFKFRSIYRWITNNIAYDVEAYFSGIRSDYSAEGVLKSRKAICEGYSSLFERLAKIASLEVVKVSGYGKGYSYTQGKKFNTTNHSWNAVKIEGNWYLLDVTWGAGYVNGRKYVKSFDDVYFLTPPEILIFNHLPLVSKWQLIEKKMSLEEFEKQIHLRPGFFKIGFSVSDVRSCLNDKTFRGFPKVYDFRGKNIIVLKAPLDRFLKSETMQQFIIKSTDASDIAIINAGSWNNLDNKNNIFSGEVMCKRGKLLISIKYPDKGDLYWNLIEYVIE